MMRTCAKVRIAADNLALRLNVTKPIFLSFLYKLTYCAISNKTFKNL